MQMPTPDDYAEAEKIILDEPRALYRFRGWLNMQKLEQRAEKRHPAIESAVIGILLSHDNEGGRVIIKGGAASETERLRARLYDIRRHTQPDFFNRRLEDHRRQQSAIMPTYKALYDSRSDLPGHDHMTPPEESGSYIFQTADAAEAALADMLRANPDLQRLPRGKDGEKSFYAMLKKAGIANASPKEVPLYFSTTDHYFSVRLDYGTGRDPDAVYLPLLRESALNDFCQQLKVALTTAGETRAEQLLQQYPSMARMVRSYEGRVEKMAQEAGDIEHRLASLYEPQQFGDAFLHSDEFERVDKLELLVDSDLLQLVRGVLTGRKADLAQGSGHPRGRQRPPAGSAPVSL